MTASKPSPADASATAAATLLCALIACPLWALANCLRSGWAPTAFGTLVACASWTLPVFSLTIAGMFRAPTALETRPEDAARAPGLLASSAVGAGLLVIPLALAASTIKAATHLRPLGAVTLAALAIASLLAVSFAVRGLVQRLAQGSLKRQRLALGFVASVAGGSAVALASRDVTAIVPHALDLLVLLGLLTVVARSAPILRPVFQKAPLFVSSAVWALWGVLVVLSLCVFDPRLIQDQAPVIAGPAALLLR